MPSVQASQGAWSSCPRAFAYGVTQGEAARVRVPLLGKRVDTVLEAAHRAPAAAASSSASAGSSAAAPPASAPRGGGLAVGLGLGLGLLRLATAPGSRHRRAAYRRRFRRLATTRAATAFDIDIKKKVEQDTDAESKTSRDMWVVLVHAPIRNCHMPWCKIPGLRRVICTCLKDGIAPPSSGGASIRSKDGKCALTVTEYAEVLTEGVPVLPRKKAFEVSSRLFESAMVNDVGTAVVIGAFKKAADEYKEKLTNLGLWVSVAPVDRDD